MSGVSTCASSSAREAALEDQQLNPRKLFVGGLGPRTTAASLKTHFERYGPVSDAAVVEDRVTGRSRGFGFIVFERDKDAEACVSQTRHNVDGVSCEIRKAVPRDDAKNAVDQGNRCKVYVGGLRENVTEAMLREYFQKFGSIEEVQLMLDRNTQRSRGFAFVLFRSAGDAENSFGSHPQLGPSAEAKFAEPRSVQRKYQQQQRAAAAAAAAVGYFPPLASNNSGAATSCGVSSNTGGYYLSAYHAPPSTLEKGTCYPAGSYWNGSSLSSQVAGAWRYPAATASEYAPYYVTSHHQPAAGEGVQYHHHPGLATTGATNLGENVNIPQKMMNPARCIGGGGGVRYRSGGSKRFSPY